MTTFDKALRALFDGLNEHIPKGLRASYEQSLASVPGSDRWLFDGLRAVLLAIRDPDDSTVGVARAKTYPYDRDVLFGWQAMVDAILAERGESK